MLIRDKKNWNKEYLVYGYYKVYDDIIYITYEDKYSPLHFVSSKDCEILDDTPSKYWIKYGENTYLPEGWNDENYLYELVDDLAPLEDKKFREAKEKIDKEFYHFYGNDKLEYQDPNINITAEPIGENWVLCPECNEAFEVDKNEGVVICPNIACRAKMNNPYAKKLPKKEE